MFKPINKLGYNLSPNKILKNLYSSRQTWRQKALERYVMIRQLKWRIRDLERSRQHWRKRALDRNNEFYDQADQAVNQSAPLRPKFHQYPLWQIIFSIELYVFSSAGYRVVAQCWLLLSRHLAVGTPSFWTVRQWVLRLGLYRLRQPIEKVGNWIYIVDYTLQMGLEQCLVVLGLRLDDLRGRENWQLCASDVRVLDVSLAHWPNAEHVQQRLQLVVQQTGQPVQIVADGARAIRKGIRQLGQSLEKPVLYTYDVSHLVALRLKKLLATNQQWNQLVGALNQVQKSTMQTALSFLAPPSLRKTARYMNLFKVVDWTAKLLAFKDRGDFELLANEGPVEFPKRFAPVLAMRHFLLQLQQLMDLVKCLLGELKQHGLSKSRWKTWEELPIELLDPLAKKFWAHFLQDMKPFVEALPDEGIWLATSDIIESVFGQYKAKGKKCWLKGISPNILFIPALVGQWDKKNLLEALQQIRCNDVAQWFAQQRHEESFLAKRRKALSPKNKKPKVVGTFSACSAYFATA